MPNAFTPEQIAQILEEFFDTVGTRQYIGARYVPIFGRKDEESIIWDNSAPYEPLTVVLYQGNSFTSRQYVPEGVEITNQEFWAQTGNYNAQIEQYRQQTAQALQVAEGAQGDIDTLLPKSAFSAENTVKDYIDKKPFVFQNVAEMKASEDIFVGAVCRTNGFYSSGDGGAAWYVIADSGTPNDMDIIQCGDYIANLVRAKTYANPLQYGAKADGATDSSDNIQRCINQNKTVAFPRGNYAIGQTIEISDRTTIDFCNSTLTNIGTFYMFSITSAVSIDMKNADVTLGNGGFLKAIDTYFIDLFKIRCRGANVNNNIGTIDIQDTFNFIMRSVQLYGNDNVPFGIRVMYGVGTTGTANVTNVGLYDCICQNFRNGTGYIVTRPQSGGADTILFINCACSACNIGYLVSGYVYASNIINSRCESTPYAIKLETHVRLNIEGFQYYVAGLQGHLISLDNEGCSAIFSGGVRMQSESGQNSIVIADDSKGYVSFKETMMELSYTAMVSASDAAETLIVPSDNVLPIVFSAVDITNLLALNNQTYIRNGYTNINQPNLRLFNGLRFTIVNSSDTSFNVAYAGTIISNVDAKCKNTFIYLNGSWVKE